MQTIASKPRTAMSTWRSYQLLFTDHLEAVNKAPMTIRTYNIAVDQLGQFLASKGMPADPTVLTREHLIEYMRHIQRPKEEGGQGLSTASALQRYRSLSAFFKWAVETDEIQENPMAKMKPPHLPEALVPVVGEDELRRLFKVVNGQGFEERRDKAIFSVFLDTGMRLSELAGITLDDVDLEEKEIVIMGKGRRQRRIAIVRETRADILRYLNVRDKHPHCDSPWLWLGKRGRLTGNGVYQMTQRRCEEASIEPIHPHQFRHTFAHVYLSNGGNEGDLMKVTGWKSRQMVDRYGASAASERARAAHERFSPRRGY